MRTVLQVEVLAILALGLIIVWKWATTVQRENQREMEQSRRIVSKVKSATFKGRFVQIDGVTFTTPASLILHLRQPEQGSQDEHEAEHEAEQG